MLVVLSNLVMRFRLKEKLKLISSQSKEVKSKFKSLLIICSVEESNNKKLFLKIAKQLSIMPKMITLVVLSKKDFVEKQQIPFGTYFISRKSIDFFGKLPVSSVDLFQKKFDLQLNYFNEYSVFSELVSASCQSKIRVGFSKSNQQINDLIFDIDLKQHKLFLKEINTYLNAIIK
jgi:hypothetical protein